MDPPLNKPMASHPLGTGRGGRGQPSLDRYKKRRREEHALEQERRALQRLQLELQRERVLEQLAAARSMPSAVPATAAAAAAPPSAPGQPVQQVWFQQHNAAAAAAAGFVAAQTLLVGQGLLPGAGIAPMGSGAWSAASDPSLPGPAAPRPVAPWRLAATASQASSSSSTASQAAGSWPASNPWDPWDPQPETCGSEVSVIADYRDVKPMAQNIQEPLKTAWEPKAKLMPKSKGKPEPPWRTHLKVKRDAATLPGRPHVIGMSVAELPHVIGMPVAAPPLGVGPQQLPWAGPPRVLGPSTPPTWVPGPATPPRRVPAPRTPSCESRVSD